MGKRNEKNTKMKIATAAWKLFSEHGYDETTVEDIIEAADAAGTVAAHFTLGAIGVEEQHAEIRLALRGEHHHQTICADGTAAMAEVLGESRKMILRQIQSQCAEDDEVIPRTVHFPKMHGVPSLSLLMHPLYTIVRLL